MTPLHEWAERWNIPAAALDELFLACNLFPSDTHTGKSEAAVQVRVRLEASKSGALLWRNNVGATPASIELKCPFCNRLSVHRQQPVRYGLANDSPAMNKRIKSADLIGIRPILIGPEHIGHTIGQFVSREVKAEGWKFKGTEREEAQMRWAMLVQQYGGDARFTTGQGGL